MQVSHKVKLNKADFGGQTFEELKKVLRSIKVVIPNDPLYAEHAGKEINIFNSFLTFKDSFATGVTNEYGMSVHAKFLFFTIAPKLMTFGLLEKVKVSGAKYEQIQTSKQGFEFLKMYEVSINTSKGESNQESTKPEVNLEQSATVKPVSNRKVTKKRTTTTTAEAKQKPVSKKKASLDS